MQSKVKGHQIVVARYGIIILKSYKYSLPKQLSTFGLVDAALTWEMEIVLYHWTISMGVGGGNY